MKTLNIEVKGIGFPNKGAELMLCAIQQQFELRNIPTKFCVEPYGDFKLRAKHGLYQKARVTKFGLDIGKAINIFPRKLLDVFGIVKVKDIDLVLDASGFSYGDQWGPDMIQYRLGSTIKTLKKHGVKVVLLPQALGPFTDEATRKVASNIFQNADFVYARDPKSFEFASICANASKLGLCSDFTNLVVGEFYANFDATKHQTCFIPNSKMLEKTNKGTTYKDFMSKLIEKALNNGQNPFVLIHEGKADLNLAKEILSKVDGHVDILEPVCPLKIKWVIGQSKVVISSRFHGLVSALSQGIPVVATGWSHKYQCLLADYNVGHALFEVDAPIEEVFKYLDHLYNEEAFYVAESNKIKSSSLKLKEQVKGMWDDVFKLLGV
ncbi:polysaccharide pyruvyl transferase family protein [Shewanella algae]|uniref:polysaccharide pyruvyl transferase family protein n=1 Tax=Shewanella algae TaxID=38313 RepID=UPI001C5712F7|nr:polysaccharide pyruvyl transferase family protein [Shewanella algae]